MKTGVLTFREKQVIELIAWGNSQKEIAEKLNVSVNTIDVHIKHIKEKTHFIRQTIPPKFGRF